MPSAPGTARSTLGERARLPQRPGDRDRADRHHRPGDGLRHHRRRAGLRAGQVQEARRRRLLQDHQPARCRALRILGYSVPTDRRDRSYAVGHGTLPNAPAHQPRHPQGQGLHGGGDREDREGAAQRVRHRVRLQPLDAWAKSSAVPSSAFRRGAGSRPNFDLLTALGFTKRRSTPPTSMSAAP